MGVILNGNAYPPPPTIRNYAEAQGISATEDFAILLLPWSKAGVISTATLQIMESTTNGQVPIYTNDVEVSSLPIDSISIPAYTLEAGRTYYGVLQFQTTTSLTYNSNFDWSFAAYVSQTQFILRAPAQPLLRIYGSPPGPLRVRFNSTPGTTYRLLGSTNLVNWAQLQTLNATQGYEEFNVTPTAGRGFFRVAHD